MEDMAAGEAEHALVVGQDMPTVMTQKMANVSFVLNRDKDTMLDMMLCQS